MRRNEGDTTYIREMNGVYGGEVRLKFEVDWPSRRCTVDGKEKKGG